MLLYANVGISELEIPTKKSLVIYISNCQHKCKNCHTPYLHYSYGDKLRDNFETIFNIYYNYFDVVCFLGEGGETIKEKEEFIRCCKYIHKRNKKVALYSGRDCQIEDWMKNFDYIKIGSYQEDKGPLTSKTTNQKLLKKINGEYQIPNNSFKAPTGKKFKGWATSKNGDIVTSVNVASNTTIYAIWEDITYTVSFNSNGGTGTMANVNDIVGQYNLPDSSFTAPIGRKFKGWATVPDGNIVTKIHVISNITLYAIWEIDESFASHKYLSGTNLTYTINKNDSATFRLDADYDSLAETIKVYVDNKLVDPKNYSTKKGSIIITFSKAFMNALTVGEHELVVSLSDNSISITKFKVMNSENTIESNDTENSSIQNSSIENVETSDNILIYVLLFIMSSIGVSISIYILRIKNANM